MGRYVIRRLLQFIPTVLGTLFLLHILTTKAIQFSGNPVRALFGDRTPPPELLEAVKRRLGYDDPCLEDPTSFCWGMYVGRLEKIFLNWPPDLGINLRMRPVLDLVGDAAPYTLKLMLIAVLFNAIVGIIAGVLAGLRGGSFMDYLVKISTVLVISMPIFVIGVLVREFIGVQFGNILRDAGWLPDVIAKGVFAAGYKADYPWASLVIPGLVLGSTSLAITARLTRTSIMENIRADYVRTAKAKGLTQKRVVGVHTLRNSLIPVITFIGLDIGASMGGAVVTETIFNVPGVGRLVTSAARTGDSATVISVVTLIALVYMVVNLIVDLLYAVLDPRIRYD